MCGEKPTWDSRAKEWFVSLHGIRMSAVPFDGQCIDKFFAKAVRFDEKQRAYFLHNLTTVPGLLKDLEELIDALQALGFKPEAAGPATGRRGGVKGRRRSIVAKLALGK